jgi:Flp pilus assembly protein TadG
LNNHLVPSNSDRGSILVEMAFSLPVLALIFLIIINCGLVVRDYQVLQNAAREGARISALKQYQVSYENPSATISFIQDRVVEYCRQENISINASDVDVKQDHVINFSTPSGSSSASLVTVSCDRSFLTRGIPFIPFTSMRLNARALFQNLYD